MRIFATLLLLFILLPWLELTVLFKLAHQIGLVETLGVVILTGVVGAGLARWQGMEAVGRIRSRLRQGGMPGDELLDGFLIFCAGLLLITPGILTDSVGFLLLIPPARAVLKRVVKRAVKGHIHMAAPVGRPEARPTPMSTDDVIDVKARDVTGDTE